MTSCSLSHDLAQQALGAEDQDQNENREGEDVLVLGPEGAAREQRQVRGGEGLEQSEHEPAQHGARDIADAAQDGRRERLEPRDEPRVRIDQTVLYAEQHARRAPHAPADEEGERDDAVDVDAHEAGRRLILRHRADGGADPRPVDQRVEAPEHQQRRDDYHEGLDRDVDGRGQLESVIKRIHARIDQVEGVAPDGLDKANDVLEKEGHADGRDERDQAGSVAQRPVGGALHQHGQRSAPGHTGHQDEQQHEHPRQRVEQPRTLEAEQDLDPDECPDDEDLRVGEVDELEHAVHHGVAEGDQRVHEAEDDAVEQNLREDVDQELKVNGWSDRRRSDWGSGGAGGAAEPPLPPR